MFEWDYYCERVSPKKRKHISQILEIDEENLQQGSIEYNLDSKSPEIFGTKYDVLVNNLLNLKNKEIPKFKGDDYTILSPFKAMVYLQYKKAVKGRSILSIWLISSVFGLTLYGLDLYYGIDSAKDYRSGWINRFTEGFAVLRVMTSGYLSFAMNEDKSAGRR
jgi:hypothetical protein